MIFYVRMVLYDLPSCDIEQRVRTTNALSERERERVWERERERERSTERVLRWSQSAASLLNNQKLRFAERKRFSSALIHTSRPLLLRRKETRAEWTQTVCARVTLSAPVRGISESTVKKMNWWCVFWVTEAQMGFSMTCLWILTLAISVHRGKTGDAFTRNQMTLCDSIQCVYLSCSVTRSHTAEGVLTLLLW